MEQAAGLLYESGMPFMGIVSHRREGFVNRPHCLILTPKAVIFGPDFQL
jgi:hypothetical protein